MVYSCAYFKDLGRTLDEVQSQIESSSMNATTEVWLVGSIRSHLWGCSNTLDVIGSGIISARSSASWMMTAYSSIMASCVLRGPRKAETLFLQKKVFPGGELACLSTVVREAVAVDILQGKSGLVPCDQCES